jgi:MFS family permease
LTTNKGVAITSFTQQKITLREVIFVQDGTETAPAYEVSVHNGISSTNPVSATITVNQSPILINPIPEQTAILNQTFIFRLPQNTFTDPDGDPLLYSATLVNGNVLPVWLQFDSVTPAFSGIPPSVGLFRIRLIARDSQGLTANADFNLSVKTASDLLSSDSNKSMAAGTIAGIVVGVAVVIGALVIGWLIYQKQQDESQEVPMETV